MEFGLNLIVIIIDQIMLFLVNMMVARHAGAVIYGDFSVATNGLMLIATLTTLGFDSIIYYYGPKYFAQKKYVNITGLITSIRNFLKPIYLSVFGFGILLAIAILAVSSAFTNIQKFGIQHPLFLFIWGAIAISLYGIYLAYFRSINFMRFAVILSFLQTLFYLILSAIVYGFLYKAMFSSDPTYFPHVMLIAFLLSYSMAVGLAIYYKKRQKYLNREATLNDNIWRNKIFGYTIQNLNVYIFSTIPLLVLEWMGEVERNVGLFAAVVSIISLAFVGISPIGILIGPEISAAFVKDKAHLKAVMLHYIIICLGLAILIVLVFGIFAKHILHAYKGSFMAALPYLYMSLINIICFSISMPLGRMMQYSKNGSNIGAKVTTFFIIFQLVMSFILIYFFKFKGAMACYIGINVGYFLALTIISRQLISRHQPELE